MRVLVTGGAGFIGGHIAEEMASQSHDVTVIDNFVPYYDLGIKEYNVEAARQAAEESGGSYDLVQESITDEAVVADLIAETDVIYHQAAQAGVRKSVEQPKKVNQFNVDGTVNILDAAREHDVNRVVVASSSSVYGKPEYLPYDEDHPTEPTRITRPNRSHHTASRNSQRSSTLACTTKSTASPRSRCGISPSMDRECARIWR